MEEELRRKQEQDEAQQEYGSEERGAALPEGKAGGRRGETARFREARTEEIPPQVRHHMSTRGVVAGTAEP